MSNNHEVKPHRQKAMTETECRAFFKSMVDEHAHEMERLQKIEKDYEHLLTLVVVVAEQKRLSLDQCLEIKLSKRDQMKSKSWLDLLQIHFSHGNGLVKG